ncbi:MAG: hypothetical protein B6D59_02535 [Campylobacteraceae bacterium 4484_4]|nr:MAG: hypothetical protein B6D59_02535 [Campylobacteraceae bacterium 4484_4]
MGTKPLVSILIPSYNHCSYVTQTLASILEDDYPNKEVVIVDDGSTDGSDETIRRGDLFERTFRLPQKPKRGFSGCREYQKGVYPKIRDAGARFNDPTQLLRRARSVRRIADYGGF